MKKIKNILIVVFICLSMNQPLLAHAEDEGKWFEAISIGFGSTGVLQGTSGLGENDQTDWAYSVDIEMSGEIMPGHTFWVIMESGDGDGAADNIGVARANPNYDGFISTSYINGNREQRINISQAYYEGQFWDDKITAAFGLMDYHSLTDGNAYANDETEQFLNNMFVRSAGVVFAEHEHYYAYTAMALVQPIDWFSFMYTYGKHVTEDLFSKGYHFLELGLHPVFRGLQGNYRIGFVLHDSAYTDYRTLNRESNTGLNISVDQALHESLGVFARAAFQENDLQENEVTSFWSAGVQIGGGLWGRPDDVIGIAHGEVDLNQDLVTANNGGETVTEGYYKFFVNDHLHVSADLQYFTDLEQAGNRDVMVFSLRTQVSF